MTLNWLNVHIVPSMMAGTIAGRISGTVTFQNFCHPLAPSISAASYSSLGIDYSAPVATTIMNGHPSQILDSRTAKNATGR